MEGPQILAEGVRVRLEHSRFFYDQQIDKTCVRLMCRLECDDSRHKITCSAVYHADTRHWATSSSRLVGLPASLQSPQIVTQILRSVIRILGVRWVEFGSPLRSGNFEMSENEAARAHAVSRPHLAAAHTPTWSGFWDDIHNRARFDPDLAVCGFPRADAETALENIRTLFPWSWVRTQLAAPDEGSWFPALCLEQLSSGALCKDPAVNSLITLGQAVPLLRESDAGRSYLARPQGVHQANLAAAFHRHNALAESGTDGSITVHHDNIRYRLLLHPARHDAVPALESVQPGEWPVIAYLALMPRGAVLTQQHVASFLDKITPGLFGNLDKPDAIVAGAMFIHGNGGPVRFSFDKILVNPRADGIAADSLRRVLVHDGEPGTDSIICEGILDLGFH